MARKKNQDNMLGPYELRGELGRGAMAVVWRGFDPTLEREVAIKEPVLPNGADPALAAELSARFVREGRAAAQLNHPGIVTIYGADIYDGRPAIVMELIEGQTLSQLIDSGRLTPAAAVGIIDQLLDAAGFAHARNVVHRDIKPDNIFVTTDGRVKLADFGIAHVGTTATMTQAGQVLGTPGYMAPEQVVGSPVDARADIFSIGVIAYELLTGGNPFGATDAAPPTTVLYRIVHEMPPTPADLDPSVPAWLAAVVARAMAKDPAARYQSAEEMRADLRAQTATAGAVAASRPGTVGLPLQQRNNTTYWMVGGAVALVAVVLLVVFSGGGIGGVGGRPASAPGAEPTTTAAPSAPDPAAAPAVPVDLSSRATLHASSILDNKEYDYGPQNLIDDNPSTCWAENVPGYGVGQWVEFDFPSEITVTGFRVVNGYDKYSSGIDRWYSNGRLRMVRVEFSDGSSQQFGPLADERGWKDLTLSQPKKTTKVRMVIVDAYGANSGTSHDAADTSVGEFHVWGTE